MRIEFFIPLLAAASVALVGGLARPTWCTAVFRGLMDCFKATCAVLWRLLCVPNRRDRLWFLAGVAAGIAFDVFCTFSSDHGMGGDLKVIGFPFVFRIAGGFVYRIYFSWPAF